MIPLKTAGLVTGFLTALVSAQAQAVIVNGDFETGDLTGWTPIGDLTFSGVNTAGALGYGVFAGTYSAYFGTVGSVAGISQVVTTTPGLAYTVSFQLANDAGGPAGFEVDWNGAAQNISLPGGAFGWTHKQFTITATTSSTTIAFLFIQDSAYFYMDNVTITAVPEPGACAVVSGLALLGFAVWSKRKR
jgi:hypothetical protein